MIGKKITALATSLVILSTGSGMYVNAANARKVVMEDSCRSKYNYSGTNHSILYSGTLYDNGNIVVTGNSDSSYRIYGSGDAALLTTLSYSSNLYTVEFSSVYSNSEFKTIEYTKNDIKYVEIYMNGQSTWTEFSVGEVFTATFTPTAGTDIKSAVLDFDDAKFVVKSNTIRGIDWDSDESTDDIPYRKLYLNQLDINGDGAVNASDAAIILRIAADMGAGFDVSDLSVYY